MVLFTLGDSLGHIFGTERICPTSFHSTSSASSNTIKSKIPKYFHGEPSPLKYQLNSPTNFQLDRIEQLTSHALELWPTLQNELLDMSAPTRVFDDDIDYVGALFGNRVWKALYDEIYGGGPSRVPSSTPYTPGPFGYSSFLLDY